MSCKGCQRRKAQAKAAAVAAWRKTKAQILGPFKPANKKEADK